MEHDYDLSTDDDSTHAKLQKKKTSTKTKNGTFKVKKSKKDTIIGRLIRCFSQYAGLYSAALFITLSCLLIRLETSVGNKIASLSWK